MKLKNFNVVLDLLYYLLVVNIQLSRRLARLVERAVYIIFHILNSTPYRLIDRLPYRLLLIIVAVKYELVGKLINIIEANNDLLITISA